MISLYNNIESLKNFKNASQQVGIHERKTPVMANYFFKKIKKYPLSISGVVSKNTSKRDIYKLLNNEISDEIKSEPFYVNWLDDMSKISQVFCNILGEKSISFWLGSQRGCKRYHVDMVPYRLLVTYTGQGTELLPNKAANRKAFICGKPNKDIIKDKSALSYVNEWDIAIFRGGNRGILHRTPDSALNDDSSLLMRLDTFAFLEEVKRINNTT